MPTRTFGPSKGNRRPTTAIPGSSGAGRPAPQKGGGGNKAAGSVEPTAANTPTVTVHSDGTVTASNFGSSKAAARETRRAARSKHRTNRIKAEVLKSTAPSTVKKAKAAPANIGLSELSRPKREVGVTKGLEKQLRELEVENHGAQNRASLLASTPTKAPVAVVKPPAQKHPRAAKKVERQLKGLRSKAHGSGHLSSAIVTTPEQRHVVKTILRTAKKTGADRKEKLAALTTGLQESGMKNLPIAGPGGGWRQEETAFYSPSTITNVKKGAQNYFQEAQAAGRGKGETPAQLSQTVQGSGAGVTYYEDNQGEARQLLHQYNHGSNPKVAAKLKQVEAKAERLGVPTKEKAPPKVVKKYKSAISAMNQIAKKGYEYQWGGGHAVAGQPTGGPGTGFDCSGAISAMLHAVGALDTPLTSGLMGQALDPGKGAITVFYNSVHTFAYIPAKKEYWGTSESTPQGGGAGWFPKSVGDAEAASGDSGGAFNVGHVPGLGKKQARQLGILHLGSGGSTSSSGGSGEFPGMTVSSDGTTATVNPGAGTHQKAVGFSKSPLTLSQRVGRTTAKLKALGVIKEPTSSEPRLTALEKKYGKPAV